MAGVGGLLLAYYTGHYPPVLDVARPSTVGWPAPDKIAQVVYTLALLGLVNFAAHTLGSAARRLLEPPVRAAASLSLRPLGALVEEGATTAVDRALAERLGLGFLSLGYGVLALAALHLLVLPALAGLVLVPAAVGAPAFVGALRARLRARAPRSLRAPGRRAWRALLGLAVALLVANAVLRAFVPLYAWDALTYHLALPERYLHDNGVHFSPWSVYSAFPLNIEMLYTLALGLVGPALAQLLSLELGLLTLWVLVGLARRASDRAGLLAAAILLADPLFLWEQSSAYADLGLCFYALLGAGALFELLEAPSRGALLRCCTFAGACVAIRYPGVAIPAAFSAILVLHRRRLGPRGLPRTLATMAGLCALLLAPWSLRNLVLAGNPFAPALQGWFHRPGSEYFDARVIAQMLRFAHELGMGHGLRSFLLLPWNLTFRSRSGTYNDSFYFQIGALYLLGLGAALLVGEVRRLPRIAVTLQLAGILVFLWFVTEQEPRFLLPAFPLFALAGGLALDRLVAAPASRSAAAAVLALPLYGVVYCQLPELLTLPIRYAVVLGELSGTAVEDTSEVHRLGEFLRATLRPGSRVLMLFESRGYYFHGLDYIPYHITEGSPVLTMVHDTADEHALRCRLEGLGVTHVVVNLRIMKQFAPLFVPTYGPEDYASDVRKIDAFLKRWTDPLRLQDDLLVAELRPARDCRPVGSSSAVDPAR